MVKIFMKSANLATPGQSKLKILKNKGHGVIVLVHDVTNKILSRELNYIVDVVMWPKFGNCNITTLALQGVDQKYNFFWGMVLVQIQ